MIITAGIKNDLSMASFLNLGIDDAVKNGIVMFSRI
jgi:hypothetical protein